MCCSFKVVSAPAVVGSAIMLAAYKKYILASLILRGDVRFTLLSVFLP